MSVDEGTSVDLGSSVDSLQDDDDDLLSDSSSSSHYSLVIDAQDLSYSSLELFPEHLVSRANRLESLQLNHNNISILPRCIGAFSQLITLDLSNNRLTYISGEIGRLTLLRHLALRNNQLTDDALPKQFSELKSLQVLNLSGNRLTRISPQILQLSSLRCLYLGGNFIEEISEEIVTLQMLEILNLGCNRLTNVPDIVGCIETLSSLVLSDNRLENIPRSLANLRNLKSLSLHNNHLSTLPTEIVALDLVELSLRNNPLIMRFVQDMVYDPPSLLELAGRVIKIKSIPYNNSIIPDNLVNYMNKAQSCVNPKCRGVYFTSCVEHVKFVDFCGKYRVPLLQYLCSPNCSQYPIITSSCSESELSDSDASPPVTTKMRKVLLG